MTEKQRLHPLTDFFRKEYRTMVRYVRTLIDDAAERDSEDIVQDVMAAVVSAADVSVPINNLAGYLYQALRNRVIDGFRRRRKHLSLDAPLGSGGEEAVTLHEVIADGKRDTGSLIENRQRRSLIMEALDALPEEQRAVVIATEIHERSFSELAESWKVPIGTLLARKSRACETIRNRMRARGFASHS